MILDGIHGVVIVDPDEETFLDYLKKQRRYKYFEQELENIKDLPTETLDGQVVVLEGNIELPEEVASVADHGGRGIGLYRSEFLFMNRSNLPTEDEHVEAYRHVAERAAPDEVPDGGRARAADAGDSDGGAHGRHADERAAGDAEAASAHPGHYAGVALHPADGGKEPRHSARC